MDSSDTDTSDSDFELARITEAIVSKDRAERQVRFVLKKIHLFLFVQILISDSDLFQFKASFRLVAGRSDCRGGLGFVGNNWKIF